MLARAPYLVIGAPGGTDLCGAPCVWVETAECIRNRVDDDLPSLVESSLLDTIRVTINNAACQTTLTKRQVEQAYE